MLVFFAVAFALALLGYSLTTSLRRTATADVEITDRSDSLTAWDKTPMRLVIQVRYVFHVGDRAYKGIARRGRENELSSIKVCYDPHDPTGNHRLEAADYSCGGFDPLKPPDG